MIYRIHYSNNDALQTTDSFEVESDTLGGIQHATAAELIKRDLDSAENDAWSELVEA